MESERRTEALAGLKVLVALAKADGVVHDNERLAIEGAMAGGQLPDGFRLDELLAADAEIDLSAELAAIKSPELRRQTFESACALVFVDGDASATERLMLERIRTAFALGDGEPAAVHERLRAALDRAFAPLAGAAEGGGTDRDSVIGQTIEGAALHAAALASMASSLPSWCAGLPLAIEVRLGQRIGHLFGRQSDAGFWRTFVANVAGSAGSRLAVSALARIAGLGGPSRAESAYASTKAFGAATKLYFEKEERAPAEDLRATYRDARTKALAAAQATHGMIETERGALERRKKELDAALAAHAIDERAYEDGLLESA